MTPALLFFSFSLAAAAPPAELLRFDATPAEISTLCAQSKKRAEGKLKELASLSAASRTFNNTPAALDDALWTVRDETMPLQFLKNVAVSSGARTAGGDCELVFNHFLVDTYAREDLAHALRDYAAKHEPLSGEDARLLEKELLAFKRSGALLKPSQRAKLMMLRRRIVELEGQFVKNLSADKSFGLFSSAELAGLPDDFVQHLERATNLYKVATARSEFVPFMENARNAQARRRLETIFEDRQAQVNLPILKDLLRFRRDAARVLGYSSHAAYVLDDRMAKTPAAASAFLDRLVSGLTAVGRREFDALTGLKTQEEGPGAGPLQAWDWRYYDALQLKANDFDKDAVKEYFPLDRVLEGLLAASQRLLGVRFRRLEEGPTWHPDVRLYEVSDDRSGEPLAYFYLDLFDRAGKSRQAEAFDLIDGRLLPDGRYRKPVAVLLFDFQKPSPERPSLLRHGRLEDLETLFHEFGHVLHATLTRAKYGRFSGFNTAADFVEAPSQMFENWAWDPRILREISGRYDDPTQKIPQKLLDGVLSARRVDAALKTLRQAALARVDLAYHGASLPSDTTKTLADIARATSFVAPIPKTHPEAGFTHLQGGYDAGYYGYLWSQVYADDLFSRFEVGGLFDPILGRRYRDEILAPGGGRDENESLRRFLGRDPSEAAFLKHLGVAP